MIMYNFEKIGFIPRSIVRTLQRFIKQIGLKTDLFVIYEFRISRYIAIASLQCFFFLIISPWIFQFFIKFFLVNFFFQTKTLNREIFINFNQQERAFSKIQTFSQKVYFEKLLESFKMIQETGGLEWQPDLQGHPGQLPKGVNPPKGNAITSSRRDEPREGIAPGLLPGSGGMAATEEQQTNVGIAEQSGDQKVTLEDVATLAAPNPSSPNVFNTKYFLECANFYNNQSISILINWILDLTTLLFFLFLLIFSKPQILILKTFCIESLLSLNETTKCFFLIFFLDLLVGFHSSKSWGIFLQFFIEHFGFQIHQNFIAFFISTFPVLLDTIFKYWIFRYLNKISPSTVATYQAMIE